MASKRKAPAEKRAPTQEAPATRTAVKPKPGKAAKPAKAPAAVGTVAAARTTDDLSALRARFSARVAGTGRVGACYFKDGAGGPDVCIPATQKECDSEGGKWSSGNCHN